MLPRAYAQQIAKKCDVSLATLDEYWSECSREYVTSGGKAETNERKLPSVGYRSQKLDELAAALRHEDPPIFSLPLLPGLRTYFRKIDAGNTEIRDDVIEYICAVRALEARDSKPLMEVSTDFAEQLRLAAQNMGAHQRRATIEIQGDEKWSIKIERQRSATLDDQKVCLLDAMLVYDATPQFKINWGTLLPGFEFYRTYQHSYELSHCISAHLHAARALLETLRA